MSKRTIEARVVGARSWRIRCWRSALIAALRAGLGGTRDRDGQAPAESTGCRTAKLQAVGRALARALDCEAASDGDACRDRATNRLANI